MNTTTSKRQWKKPSITRKGDIVELTQQTYKQVGFQDGYVLIPDVSLANLS